MPKIQIADKPTLDAVSAAVDSKFTPIKFAYTQGSTTEKDQTTAVTLLDIRGKGEVLYVVASTNLERYNEDTLKITVDDNVIYHVKWVHAGATFTSSASIKGGVFGVTRADSWTAPSPDFYWAVLRDGFGLSPNLQVMTKVINEDKYENIVVPFRGVLKFEKSFVVEATTNAIQTASTIGWTCQGAYLLEE